MKDNFISPNARLRLVHSGNRHLCDEGSVSLEVTYLRIVVYLGVTVSGKHRIY